MYSVGVDHPDALKNVSISECLCDDKMARHGIWENNSVSIVNCKKYKQCSPTPSSHHFLIYENCLS